jgi:uncharacterized protein (TIGR03790 family)
MGLMHGAACLTRYLPSLVLAGALFGQSSRNVLLVVNKSSPQSVQIASFYAKKRRIPAGNVCRIQAPVTETVSRREYEETIETAVAKCLKSRGLTEHILYIATTLGVPLRISGKSGQGGDYASVDSELAVLYQHLHGAKPVLEGPLPNPFYGRRDEPFGHPRFPIYLVCRLAAYDVAEVKGMIERALAAENRGKVVLDLRGEDSTQGNGWLRTAALLLPKERVALEETAKVVDEATDVIGYGSWGSNDPSRKERFVHFRWLPGAIMTEYVSTNGRTFARPPDTWNIGSWKAKELWFAGAPQTLSADYLHEGATGASGHVYEPYLSFCPRPDYLFPAYLAGRNLAESYYLSIPAVSWQNIVLGDPLCRLK